MERNPSGHTHIIECIILNENYARTPLVMERCCLIKNTLAAQYRLRNLLCFFISQSHFFYPVSTFNDLHALYNILITVFKSQNFTAKNLNGKKIGPNSMQNPLKFGNPTLKILLSL